MSKAPKLKQVCLSCPDVYILVKSGWEDRYHLIYETPEKGDYHFEHEFLTKNEVKNKYPFLTHELH